jgi:hypothetical protein
VQLKNIYINAMCDLYNASKAVREELCILWGSETRLDLVSCALVPECCLAPFQRGSRSTTQAISVNVFNS